MHPERIVSAQNPLFKSMKTLADRSNRIATGTYLAEGVRLIREALACNAPIERLIIGEKLSEDAEWKEWAKHIPVSYFSDELVARLADTGSPQGVLAVLKFPTHGEPGQGCSRLMVLEHVQDPGNVGTIIRTADACGFQGVILSGDCADPWQSKVIRSTMGSIWHLPVWVVPELSTVFERLQREGIRLTVAHPRDATACWEADLSDGVALLVGNEANGVRPETLSRADLRVIIPMEGRAESLNAATAAGMLMYESLRQRRVRL